MNQQTTILTLLEEEEQESIISLPGKILIECSYCSKEFVIYRSEYLKRVECFESKTYCSRTCYNKNRPYRYNNYYYCDSCTCWVPQNEAIITTINIKFHPMCPKPSCNKNRLRLSSAKAKLNHKRENVKRIE